MARTAAMRLVELMVLKEDIDSVLKYIGSLGAFQFQTRAEEGEKAQTPEQSLFDRLEKARVSLELPELDGLKGELQLPEEGDYDTAVKIIETAEELHNTEIQCGENAKHALAEYNEAVAFTNLKVSYSELESLSFMTIRVGKIDPSKFDSLKAAAGSSVTIVKLGEDGSRILAASSKKGRFQMDSVLKDSGFVEIEIPKDFMGIPDDYLAALKDNLEKQNVLQEDAKKSRLGYAQTHRDMIYGLLQKYSVASSISHIKASLESTEYVYRITGWIPAYLSREMLKSVDAMTEKRTSLREYLPSEVPSVVSGQEKVPVHVRHGKVVQNFERMIFSYGSPLYGTIDPTPFVAVFFTILFGIMFGDAGQGLCFLIVGILCCLRKIKISGWEKFGPVFCCIGVSSTIMGILTGEFFANEKVLEPLAMWITGLFGESRPVILHMMPSSDPHSIMNMFKFFGFTIAVGFVINTCGIFINMINQFSLHRPGKAIFGKTGVTGALFFWYVVYFGLSVAFLGHVPSVIDYVIILGTLLVTAFGEPLERLVEGHRPVMENGLLSCIIGAVVEIIEIVSSYLSNTVSFVRVGAFALAHAVLGYIINSLVEITPGPGGILVAIVGNAIVVVLEGMIVAIQVVRLQYYEFFSKFFTETGREFKPFRFEYKEGSKKA